jgi:hypothetical protein
MPKVNLIGGTRRIQPVAEASAGSATLSATSGFRHRWSKATGNRRLVRIPAPPGLTGDALDPGWSHPGVTVLARFDPRVDPEADEAEHLYLRGL